VNPRELQGKYARLRGELVSPAVTGEQSKAWRARLARDVTQLDLQLAVIRCVAQALPMVPSQKGLR
jgi:hypothetical protein